MSVMWSCHEDTKVVNNGPLIRLNKTVLKSRPSQDRWGRGGGDGTTLTPTPRVTRVYISLVVPQLGEMFVT